MLNTTTFGLCDWIIYPINLLFKDQPINNFF